MNINFIYIIIIIIKLKLIIKKYLNLNFSLNRKEHFIIFNYNHIQKLNFYIIIIIK